MNPSSVLLAAIASGGLAGALIGFLVASQTGSESTASIPVEVNTTGDTDTQLAMLRQQLGDMESRLSSVELRSTVTTARAPQTAPVEGLDEIRELLAALVAVYELEDRKKGETEEAARVRDLSFYVQVFVLLLMVVGVTVYARKQRLEHAANWSWSRFFFGVRTGVPSA